MHRIAQLALVSVLLLWLTNGRPGAAAGPLVFGPLNDVLYARLVGSPAEGVEIAPMTAPGTAEPGPWRAVGPDLFASLLANTGIIACQTDPVAMKGRPGVIETIKTSEVLTGGSRATIGWFIRSKRGNGAPIMLGEWVKDEVTGTEMFHESGTVVYAPGPDLFVLMSYDTVPDRARIAAGADPDFAHLCAFEVFIFGPVDRSAGTGGAVTAPLVEGTAVNADGNVLQGVPLEIAEVRNFLKDHPAGEAVFSGIDPLQRGCRTCHERSDQFPQTTLPFPWLAE